MADRISALPDELLCHILSFLQTEDVVATSIFSKRWRNLWRSVTSLSFFTNTENNTEDEEVLFKDFVYSVLLLRNAATPIKKFLLRIEIATDLEFPSISKWVNFVTQCRVKHLNLHVTTHMDLPELPSSILRCATLVVLKSHGFYVKWVSFIGLSSLKILHLVDFEFESGPLLNEFLAGCPILEDLRLHDIRFVSHESSFHCQELKSLSLSKLTRATVLDSQLYFPLKLFSNVKFLGAEVKKLHDGFPSFHNLTLLELHIDLDKSQLLAEMLNHCPNLQSLSLQNLRRRRHSKDWTDPEFVPECLSSLRTCNFRDFEDLQVELQLATYILKNAKVLQTMTIFTRLKIDRQRITTIREELLPGLRSPSRCQLIFK